MKIKIMLLLILICLTACTSKDTSDPIQIQSETKTKQCLNESQQLKEQETINSFIQNSKQCQSDSDCKLVFLGCPFDCGTAINTESVGKVQSMVDDYNKNSCYGCDYDCAYLTEVKCVENACIASLGLMRELETSEN